MTGRQKAARGLRALTELQQGESGTVAALDGGHEFQSRAVALGLVVGARVTLQQRDPHGGPLLVAAGQHRAAIGRGMAEKVLIGEAPKDGEAPDPDRSPTTLDHLEPGRWAVVEDVTLTGADLQRLLDLGFVEGTIIGMIRNAPLLDPIDVSVRGAMIAVRREEAGGVEVRPL